ncbi:MAG: hypothetical protein ABSH26_15980 [Opitutaceae bacterium]
MRTILAALPAGLALLGACTAQNHPQAAPGATHVGAPSPPFDQAVLDGSATAYGNGAERAAILMPDRITLPATYRLILVDGHLALVRETDAQALQPGPTSMRIVMGEIARGELAYQPALLPQELAAEVASDRESAARMDNALESVMRRSRELSEQARQLEEQGRRLAELLAAAQARAREPEPAGAPGPGKGAPVQPEPKAQTE